MPLALKYRPRVIEDLKGQDHIQKVLRGVLERYNNFGELPRVILLHGSYGSGKTTSARLLARYVNCEKGPLEACGKCQSCIETENDTNTSVMEIDAASNRGIDDIRELKVRLQYKTPYKIRVIILDECHALTKESANALLKDLEEGNPTDVFVMCTTDYGSVLDTIKSRALVLQINNISPSIIQSQILEVAQKEGIKITEEASATIADLCGGHCRDALTLLETTRYYSGDKEIKASVVLACSGYGSAKQAREFITAFLEENPTKLIELCKASKEDASRVIKTILQFLKLELAKFCESGKCYFNVDVSRLVELNSLFHVARYHFEKNGFSLFLLVYFLECWMSGKPLDMLTKIR